MAFKSGDANERILELVNYAKVHPKCATLVLLDPFGMQLNWETIQALKDIKHIDLWILVPSGVIVFLLEVERFCVRRGWRNRLECQLMKYKSTFINRLQNHVFLEK